MSSPEGIGANRLCAIQGPGPAPDPAGSLSLKTGLATVLRCVSPGTSDRSNLELITLTCTCVAATLFWLLLTLFIRKLKRVRTFQGGSVLLSTSESKAPGRRLARALSKR